MLGLPLRLGKLACHRGHQSVLDDGFVIIIVALVLVVLLPLLLLIPLVALGLLPLLLLATIR
eukprot:8553859-Heterocapsa_arctica.AAC.1